MDAANPFCSDEEFKNVEARFRISPGTGKSGAAFADLLSWLEEAEGKLSPFGASKLRSKIKFTHSKPSGSNWRSTPSIRAEFERQRDGWALCSLASNPFCEPPLCELDCAPFGMLRAAGDQPESDCGILFLSYIEQGLFPIDLPLPGAYPQGSSHREPLSALEYCALLGRAAWVEKLIALGAAPNKTGAYGKTPLHHCARNAHLAKTTRCIQILLAAGADPLAKNASGKTPAASVDAHQKDNPAAELLAQAARSALEALKINAALDKAQTNKADPENRPEPAPARKSRL